MSINQSTNIGLGQISISSHTLIDFYKELELEEPEDEKVCIWSEV